ncbi:MAG TPA: hypothetical protein VHC48_12070 [Puia sp.]|nr:hypothetical protein [Puia sp.]
MYKIRAYLFCLFCWTVSGKPQEVKESSLRKGCMAAIHRAAISTDFWVRVHAVEYLIALDRTAEASTIIHERLALFNDTPQKRIGYWRTSYRVAGSKRDSAVWLGRIRDAYLDTSGPDRLHAVETLCKLGYPLKDLDPCITGADRAKGGELAGYVIWGKAIRGRGRLPDDARLMEGLRQEEKTAKVIAYALGFMDSLPPAAWKMLSRKALAALPENSGCPYLLSASVSLWDGCTEKKMAGEIRNRLLLLGRVGDKTGRIECCRALARKGAAADLPLLIRLLRNKITRTNPEKEDVCAAAAYAILCILARQV